MTSEVLEVVKDRLDHRLGRRIAAQGADAPEHLVEGLEHLFGPELRSERLPERLDDIPLRVRNTSKAPAGPRSRTDFRKERRSSSSRNASCPSAL